ncbi:MAG TPA: transcriptional regulator [Syntrophobacteraceae bacterium]|nr:transcriptional regulator [Syntrophobacteraceae bacterium]
MPEVCRFYGIIIAMFFEEHNPPHFHARYGRNRVAIRIEDFRILDGQLPPRALGLVIEWAAKHQEELMNNWNLTRMNQPPCKIEPLE